MKPKGEFNSMKNQRTFHDLLLMDNLSSLKTTLAALIPEGPYSAPSASAISSYKNKFNLLSADVLRQRLEVYCAGLTDWEENYSTTHSADLEFHDVEALSQVAYSRLLDVRWDPMDLNIFTAGNKSCASLIKNTCDGKGSLRLTTHALRPFFFR